MHHHIFALVAKLILNVYGPNNVRIGKMHAAQKKNHIFVIKM